MFLLIGKVLRGQALYRYSLSDVHRSGWAQTAVRPPFDGRPGHDPALSADGKALLRSLRLWAEQHRVRVAYPLPWAYVEASEEAAFRQENRDILLQIAQFFPVLKDPRLGACSTREYFSDSAWHLTEDGSALRTDELAQHIKRWELWTEDELRNVPLQPAAGR